MMKLLLVLVALITADADADADAATLKEQFVDQNQDRICVYTTRFDDYYLNVGFSGHYSFNVPDSEVVPSDE
ncbi:hypothetical protein ABKT18_03035 [Enterobacter hormaechei]